MKELGELETQGFELKRKGEGVSSDEIDSILRIGKEEGALGGKLMGAGGAKGTIQFIVPPEKRGRLLHGLHRRELTTERPFKVAREGSRVVYAD